MCIMMKDKPILYFSVVTSALLLGGLTSSPAAIPNAFAQTSIAGSQENTTTTLHGVISSI